MSQHRTLDPDKGLHQIGTNVKQLSYLGQYDELANNLWLQDSADGSRLPSALTKVKPMRRLHRSDVGNVHEGSGLKFA
ncbi:MAG: hypothetical protein R3C05_09540 [Pirellulaceae bacterium]